MRLHFALNEIAGVPSPQGENCSCIRPSASIQLIPRLARLALHHQSLDFSRRRTLANLGQLTNILAETLLQGLSNVGFRGCDRAA